MEEVFNIVYSDALAADSGDDAVDAYRQLLRMYREVIRATTNPLNGSSRDGVGALLRFLNRVDPNVTIDFVTFNQDLLIEKAIHEALGTTSYAHIPFNLESAYHVEFDGFVDPKTTANFRRNLVAGRPSYAVLKLHGSLNWVDTVRSVEDARTVLRDPTGKLYCLDDPTIRLQVKIDSGSRTQHTLPFIVPPIYEKSGVLRDKLRPVWAAAREAIRRADEILIFGYSFPQADIAARNTLRAAFHENKKADSVTIIDPANLVAAGIASWVDCRSYSVYRSVRAFVESWRARARGGSA